MRCLVVADLHYALQQYDWVIDVAPAFDVVIIAGDHLEIASLVDRRTQSVVIQKYIQRLKERTRLIVCSGITISMRTALKASG
jgi:Icc-related predicted phosphoesterase